MHNKRLLICDLDNTLYDWVGYFVPSFYAMVDEAVRITGCDRETLLDDFRRVHQAREDSEQPFALLETETIKQIYPDTPAPLYQVSESLTPAADSRIGIYLIHHGKQLSRGLPCLLRFRFALTLTRLACACWRGDRGIPIRPGVSWHWPRFMMAARGRMRHGSAGSGCRLCATGLSVSTPKVLMVS